MLKICVTEEFNNAIKVNSLKKKAKMERNKGKNFRSVNLLDQFHLHNKEVEDE